MQIYNHGVHREFLVSSEPLGLVFDPEAQTRRELVAERLIVEVSRVVFHGSFDSTGQFRDKIKRTFKSIKSSSGRAVPILSLFFIWVVK